MKTLPRGLVVLTILAMVTGCGKQADDVKGKMPDDPAVIAALEQLGAKIEHYKGEPDNPVIKVDFRDTQVTDEDLKRLKELKYLSELDLTGTLVTDAGLKEVARAKSLDTLYLSGTKVTDEGVKELKGLRKLESLDLSLTKVTDAGIAELTGLKKLVYLRVYSTKVTEAGLKEIQKALPDCRTVLDH